MDMRTSSYIFITGVIFLAIAVLHLTRALSGWPAVIGNVEIPVSASWIAFVVAAVLVFSAFRLHRR